jgi:transcriptional regulator with XRE-family HTH domain
MRRRELVDSEGARLLRLLLDDERSADVARAVGVTRQAIDHLAGLRRRFPSYPLLLALRLRYGIPVESWGAPPEVATSVSEIGPILKAEADDSAA